MKKKKSKKLVMLMVIFMFGMSVIHLPVVNAGEKTTKTKAVCTIKKYSDTYKNSENQVIAVYSYQLPQLSGNSEVVKKINASLKKDYKESLEGKEKCFETAKEFEKYKAYINPEVPLCTKTTCKISYNKNGYVSFKYHSRWYAGGVGNTWTYGMTYDLKTGKKLTVSHVISGNKSAVKKKIINKYCSKIADSDEAKEELNGMKISDFQFYLKNGKVVVCFGPYQPGGGNRESHITLKGNYE